MSASILDFFESYIRTLGLFSTEEIALIKSFAIPKRLKNGHLLLNQGSVCTFYTFVCSGCLRSYQTDDKGREHIFSFSSTNHWVSDSVSLAYGTPSKEYIDALEDSHVIQFSVDSFNTLLREVPNFYALNTKIITENYRRNRERIYMMTNHQAEERYLQFMRFFPQLHHRLPVYVIASYIGVTRETLTRIRSNMIHLGSVKNSYEALSNK